MTYISKDIAAAIPNGNTTTNVIIWNTAKAPWSGKNISGGGGHNSRQRYSRRNKQQTPISKDTDASAGGRSSGRRRSRRKKQKHELNSIFKSNVSLVNKATTTSKHAKGTFSVWPISSTRNMSWNFFLLAPIVALLFISNLLDGKFTADSYLPTFQFKDPSRSMNDGFYSKNMLFKPEILSDFNDDGLKSSGLSAEDWLGAPEASSNRELSMRCMNFKPISVAGAPFHCFDLKKGVNPSGICFQKQGQP